jgi:F0F1-type ATP synthase assembly protein I
VTDRPDNEKVEKREGEEPGRSNRRAAINPAAAYQGAFEAVFAILIAGLIGYFADEHFGTSPRYLLIGFAIGFASFVLRLVRMGQAQRASTQQGSTAPGTNDSDDDDRN